MEISNEIGLIRASKGNTETALANLANQKEELDKKVHLVKVFGLVCVLEDMINAGVFEDCGVHFMNLKVGYNIQIGRIAEVLLLDKNKRVFKQNESSEKYLALYSQIRHLFKSINGFEIEHVNEKLSSPRGKMIEVVKDAQSKVLELLLSEELMAAFKYSELNNELGFNDKPNAKKMKV